MIGSIYLDVMGLIEREDSKESKKVFNALNKKSIIKDIITDGYVFWFKEDNCPNYVRYYLKQLIKRRMCLLYSKEVFALSYWDYKRINESFEQLLSK